MDPEASWELLVCALMNGDAKEAAEHARNLAEWVDVGGMIPEGTLKASRECKSS